ncbi:hypothetical protein ACWD6S_39620, partial [Streptomyces zhihengii]
MSRRTVRRDTASRSASSPPDHSRGVWRRESNWSSRAGVAAAARALDAVGDRWTLLVVRELLAGPRRYTD